MIVTSEYLLNASWVPYIILGFAKIPLKIDMVCNIEGLSVKEDSCDYNFIYIYKYKYEDNHDIIGLCVHILANI